MLLCVVTQMVTQPLAVAAATEAAGGGGALRTSNLIGQLASMAVEMQEQHSNERHRIFVELRR